MKRFESMQVTTDIGLGALTELLAVSGDGSVTALNKFEVRGLIYEIFSTDGGYSVALEDDEAVEVEKEDLVMPIAMFLGAALIGGKPVVEGRYKDYFPSKEFLDKRLPQTKIVLDRNASLFDEVELSINDLQEIADNLCDNQTAIDVLDGDADFRRVFPGLFCAYGEYGPARHKSGVRVKAAWTCDDDAYHKIEAPLPCAEVLNLWLKEVGIEAYDPPFAEVRKKLWQQAKMLSRVPEADRRRVFEWADEVAFEIEQFHSYRGGSPINKPLEVAFSTGIMTVDTNLNWEMVEA